MANYYALISKAVNALPEQNSETRKAIYDRARLALLKQLRGMQPALPEKDITNERLGLEEAIRKIEFELLRQKPQQDIPVTEPIIEVAKPEARQKRLKNPEVITSHFETPEVIPTETAPILDTSPIILASEPTLEPPQPLHYVEEAQPILQEVEDFIPKGRIKFDHPQEEKNILKGSLPLILGGALAAFLLVLGALWLFVTPNQPPAPKPAPAVIETPKPTTAIEKKNDQRVSQDAPIQSNTPPSPPPVAAQAAPLRDGRVILFEETPGGVQQGITIEGSVKWSMSGGSDPVISAVVTIPDRLTKITLSFAKNKDAALPASHLIDLSLEAGSQIKITQMPGFLMKIGEQTRGQPISGQGVKITDNSYLIGLSSTEADVTRNLELIKDYGFLDFPIEIEGRRRGILTLEKNTMGEKVFNDAFKAWGQ